jgi:subtilisin family serine protease
MANIPQPHVIARRALLLTGWALAFVAMAHHDTPQQTPAAASQLPARIETVVATPATLIAPASAIAAQENAGQSFANLTPPNPHAVMTALDDDEDARPAEPKYVEAQDIPPTDASGRPNYVPGQLIVRFRSGTSADDQHRLIESLDAKIVSVIGSEPDAAYLVALPADLDVPAGVKKFAQLEEIDYAEPEILHYIESVPSDSLYGSYDGQPGELQRRYYNGVGNDRCLNAEAAWDITTGNTNIVIAVIDTGVQINHPDLVANTWFNPREIATNGADDDRNGYVDDSRGWDFYYNDRNPRPDFGDTNDTGNVYHGTFVAGCIAAMSNNGVGVAGVSWRSKIMPLKVFGATGGAPASAIASALHYAADNGAHIVNMSFGSSYATYTISDAINYAWSKGLLLIAAAGNGNSSAPQYPARYPNVISVGGSAGGSRYGSGTGNIAGRASFTQYGPDAVDVVAPAVDIVSTAVLSASDEAKGWGTAGTPTYFFGSGTSFAASLVAGEAALLMSRAQDLGLAATMTNADYRQYILNATVALPDDPTDSPNAGPTWANRGRVDLLVALQRVGAMPNAASNAVAAALSRTSVQLTWRDASNNEQSYMIKRAIVTGSVTGAFQILANLPPNATMYTDNAAQPRTSYVYKVIAINVTGRGIAFSNVVTTPP